MNLFDLSVSDLLIWGIVLHLVGDWVFQNDWMANNKMYLKESLAGYVHAGIHCLLLSVIFWWVAIPLAILHLLIDTRKPVTWWSKAFQQTQPKGNLVEGIAKQDHYVYAPLYDMGTEVRIWTDQVFHIICIAIASLVVGW